MTRRDLFTVNREVRHEAERALSGSLPQAIALQRIYAIAGAVIAAESVEADAKAEVVRNAG